MLPKAFIRFAPFCLLAVVVAVLAVATVADPAGTSGPASPTMYGTWWFVGLWGMMTLSACLLIYKRRLWNRPAVFALHLSFIVILTGSLITYITSRKGFIHLRQGEVTNQYMYRSEDGGVLRLQGMPFLLALDSFHIEFDSDGVTPADYVSEVTVLDHQEKHQAMISMNCIAREHGYRIFQTSYDDDAKGSVFTVSFDPYGTAVTYAGYLLLAISMVWLGCQRRQGQKTVRNRSVTILMTLCGVLLASYMVFSIAFRPLLPVLRSPLLFIHVGVIMVSYVLLVVSMVRRGVLRYAVFFLSAGIFLGAIWANISWGSYWSWDPKETWAIITLLVYSVPLHQESLPWFRSERHYRLYSILCLLCLLMTYFGVNYLLGGMHSYAN